MMKSLENLRSLRSLRNLISLVSLISLTSACTEDDNFPAGKAGSPLAVQITAQGFVSGDPGTRATDSGYNTTFAAGDSIGIFAVVNGTVQDDNVAYRYDGSAWNAVGEPVYNYPGGTYIAYYPRDPAMTGMTSEAQILAAFTPKTDQSTPEAYTASDLMTGSGRLSGGTLDIALTHALSLLEVKLPDAVTAVTLSINSQPVIPYEADSIRRFLVKPIDQVTVAGSYKEGEGGKTMTFSKDADFFAGKYTRFNVTSGGGSTSDVTVTYTDGTFETVSLPASGAPFVFSDGTGKTIHDITLTDGTKYLIGRKVDPYKPLCLNLASTGVLGFRTAEDGTILIGSYAEFQLIYGLYNITNKYKLEADLDLMNEEWRPIAVKEEDGGGTLTEYFYGTFDGGGFKIENLQIGKSGSGVAANQTIGLFQKNKGAIINVHVVSGTITGKGYGGGICGVNAGGSIEKCSNGAMITTTENYAGGITGQNTAGGTINACYNTGAITGGNYVGGVAGYNSKDTNVSFITACYNTGDVTGNSNVGGVVGYNTGSFITACYNTGDVTGTVNHIGGVAGYNDGSIITACYNIGDVTGTGTKKNIGSVVGNNISSNNANKIVACYTKKKVQVTGIAVPGTLFSGDAGAWPLETTNDAWKLYHNGGYWKSLGNWNDGWEGNTPTELPKLWFE